MTVTFYGAASEVTGSSFLLKTEKYSILVDCGLFQGTQFAEKENYQPLPFDAKSLDAMLLTHAHLDHCGRVPKLWKDGYRKAIYSTPPTKDLSQLIMADAADIMTHEASERQQEPLYLPVDVASVMPLFKTLDYRKRTEILPGVFVTFYDAGHILGSASILVEADETHIVFSGDIGNDPVPIMHPPETPPTADFVVMETTYGSRLHEDPTERRVKLRSVISQTVERNGTLLIPSFALERTQEILYEIAEMMREHSIPTVPIFLDSPLASEITAVYRRYESYYDEAAQLLILNGMELFNFPTLKIVSNIEESKAIREVKGAKVVIAGSGMMEGGRIRYHARDFLDDGATTLLFVGYQGKGTLGRALYDGKRIISLFDRRIHVKARVVAIGAYSAHADREGLKRWLSAFSHSPEQVCLVHGEVEESSAFAKTIAGNVTVVIPKRNQTVNVGED